MYFSKDPYPLIVDTKSSIDITPCLRDFISYELCAVKIKGLAHENEVVGRGKS